jgi:flagellar M-ring protein FliF
VPQLNPKNVSVVDQEGKLISQQIDPLRDAGLDAAQIRFVREIEAAYVQRIESILAPIVGASQRSRPGGRRHRFSQTDQVAETYRPNPTPATAIRSQLTSETGSGTPPAAGVPGALSNQPPAPATAPLVQPAQASAAARAASATQNFSRNSTVNYEIDKTIRHTKGVPGSGPAPLGGGGGQLPQGSPKDPKDAPKAQRMPPTQAAPCRKRPEADQRPGA